MKATKLRITSLKFISAVDAGAQGPISNVALVKRAPTGDEYCLTAKVAKLDDALGVVFGYAVASTVDGGQSPHVDLQGDAVAGGDELIKVALGFAEAGAASDVMHDCIKDGWVPFVMPLNAETKKAFKLTGDVEGIAIGMKPSTETYKRFQTGELAAFSIYGTGIREPLDEAKRAPQKVAKAALYTDEVDGHAHKICIYDDGSLYVEYATMGGAENAHTHGIVRGDDGSLTILADSGHSHALAEGQPSLVVVEPDAIVVVAARAPHASTQSKSTRLGTMPDSGLNTTEKSQMDKDKQIADLTAKNAELEKRSGALSRMSAVAFAVFKSLTGSDADAFLTKTGAEQDAAAADIAKRAEESEKVVYLSKTDGTVYKAKDDPRLVEMAKRLDGEAEKVKKAAIVDLRKSTFKNAAAGKDEVLDRFIEKHMADEEEMTVLRAMVENSRIGKAAPGFSGGTTEGGNADPMEAFEKGLVAFAKSNNIKNVWTDARAAFEQTDEGKALKRALDESTAG